MPLCMLTSCPQQMSNVKHTPTYHLWPLEWGLSKAHSKPLMLPWRKSILHIQMCVLYHNFVVIGQIGSSLRTDWGLSLWIWLWFSVLFVCWGQFTPHPLVVTQVYTPTDWPAWFNSTPSPPPRSCTRICWWSLCGNCHWREHSAPSLPAHKHAHKPEKSVCGPVETR